MTTYTIYFCTYFFESIIANMYFSDNFNKRFNTLFTYILGGVLYSVGFAVNSIGNNSVFLNLFCFFILNILIAELLYTDIKWTYSIFHSAILLALMFGSEMVVESIMVSILNLNYDSYRDNYYFLITLIVLSKSVYLIVCKMLSYFFSYRKLQVRNIKSLTYIFIFPIMSTLMLTLFSYASIIYEFSRTMNTIFVIVSVLSLALSCTIFIIYRNMQITENELLNLQAEQQKNELNKTFYELLEKKNNEQRVLVHDIKHHLSVIGLMSSINEIQNYISTIKPEIERYHYIGKSNNKMLDLILSKYSLICSNKRILFTVDIRSSNLSFIEDTDLVSLLGNLLDNAIEASENSDNPYVRFVTRKEKNFVMLNIKNSTSQAPVVHNRSLVSTKTNTALHGYGTKSIENTVEKYNGICEWNYNETTKEFIYNILFNEQ